MNIKGIKRIFENRKGITAISLAASIVSGNLIGIVIDNAICENRKNSDRDNLFSEYSQSEVVEIFDDPKTEYLNVFDIQMDETKIVKMSDKNGIDITNYVKNCSITKTEESKIYLDNGYIIYYDNDGFKYIKGDIYKEKDDHTKIKLLTNVIAYVNKYTNQVIGYDNCKNMYDSGVDYEKIVDELLNDDNFINFYREEYSADEDFSKLYSSNIFTKGVTCHDVSIINYSGISVFNYDDVGDIFEIFRFYDGREEEFEKEFGFPMYVTNKDGLKVYNIYKLAIINSVIPIFGDLPKYLLNSYNKWLVEINNFDIIDESKEVFIKMIKDELSQSCVVPIKLYVYKEDNSSIFSIDSNIDEITNNGDLILVNSDNSKIIINYDDLVSNNQHYRVCGRTYELKQPNIFDDDNINFFQYGGDQMIFSSNAKKLLEDPIIVNELRESYPDATMEDYELYLNKLCCSGCGYVAYVNTIFKEYETRPEEFEKIFGFPMYTLKDRELDFNYEYLILDYFNYIWANSGYTIQEICGDLSKDTQGKIIGDYTTGEATGFDNSSYSTFPKYLNDKYNIEIELNEKYLKSEVNRDFVTPNNSFDYDGILDAYNELKTDDNSVIIGSGNYDLYLHDDYIKYGRLTTRVSENGGGHCMTVTDITDDGNFIVSSWGRKYVFDISSIKRNEGNIDVHAINFKK